MGNDSWKTPPKILHKPTGIYIGHIKLEFGSRKIHGKYRKPVEYYRGQYVTRRGHIRFGQRRTKARTLRFIVPFASEDIQVVEGTLKEPRFWYSGGTIRKSKWTAEVASIPSQELEKICIDYGRHEVRGSVIDVGGKRYAHKFRFDDTLLIVRGYREDE